MGTTRLGARRLLLWGQLDSWLEVAAMGTFRLGARGCCIMRTSRLGARACCYGLGGI